MDDAEDHRVTYIRDHIDTDTVKDIAAALEISETTVRRLRDRNNIGRRKPRRLEKSHEELLAAGEAIRTGARSSEDIAKEWGFTSWTVREHIRRAHVIEARLRCASSPDRVTKEELLRRKWTTARGEKP